jgi:transcription elongation factor Elf1
MRFGVILCPHCKTARGIVMGTKTTSCAKCGKKVNLKVARLLLKVDSESELAQAVGEINLKLNNGKEIYQMDLKLLSKEKESKELEKEPQDIYDRIAGKLSEITGRDQRIKMAAKELYFEIGWFTEKDFFEVLKRLGIQGDGEIKNYLARLLENDYIYQHQTGIYHYIQE